MAPEHDAQHVLADTYMHFAACTRERGIVATTVWR